jgi:lysophospholipase L1-like esterase
MLNLLRRSVLSLLLLAIPLLLPSPAAATSDKESLVFIGDSVMLGAESRIVSDFSGEWNVTFDSKVSRSTKAGLDVVRQNKAAMQNVVVIALGYNDGFSATAFKSRSEAILNELGDIETVIWLNMRKSLPTYDYSGANQVLEDAKAKYPNLIVADWDTRSHQIPNSSFGADGLHLRPAGATAMSAFIKETVDNRAPKPDPNARCEVPDIPLRQAKLESARGYWLLDSTGEVHGLQAPTYGDIRASSSPAMAMQATPTGEGYWIVDLAGKVTAFGDADFLGDMTSIALNAPIIELVANPTGTGYWLVAADGGVFSFGDSKFYGSMGGIRLIAPVISMASTASGDGYWLVASDGGVFSFGDAEFKGSTGGQRLNAPVTSMAATVNGSGYWLYAADGGVFTFGAPDDIKFYGSLPGLGYCVTPRAVQLRVTGTGDGYWIATSDGRVLGFGDAWDRGGALESGREFIDLAIRR